MQINIPNCDQFTTALTKAISIAKDFNIVLDNRVTARGLEIKKELLNLKISEFNLCDPYDCDIIFRAALCKDHDFNEIQRFNRQDTAVARDEDGRFYIVDRKGKTLSTLPSHTVYVDDFSSEGIAISRSNSNIGHRIKTHDVYTYINHLGENLIEGYAGYTRTFSEGFGCAKFGTQWRYMNKNGDSVLENELSGQITSAENFSEGVAFLTKNNKTIGVNTDGKLLYQFDVEPLFPPTFSEGLLGVVVKEDKYCYYDHNFEQKLGPYHWGSDFSEGKAWVVLESDKDNDKWTCINKNGDPLFVLFTTTGIISRCKFIDDFSWVKTEIDNQNNLKKRIYLNSNGIDAYKLFDLSDEACITSYENGFFNIEEGNKRYRMDKKGRKIFEWTA